MRRTVSHAATDNQQSEYESEAATKTRCPLSFHSPMRDKKSRLVRVRTPQTPAMNDAGKACLSGWLRKAAPVLNYTKTNVRPANAAPAPATSPARDETSAMASLMM